MARRCVCAKLLDQLRTDPRLRALPLATRAVWLEIVAGLVAWAPSGRIRFPLSVPQSVSRWVGESVSETETHLETLRASGLVALDADGLGLSVPEMEASHSRAEINRINGLKGGRPKKQRPPDPSQREMLMVHQGSALETQETETAKPLARAEKIERKIEDQSSAWVSIGNEVADALGIPETGFRNVRIVAQWLADGATREMLLEIAEAMRQRSARPIGSVRFMQREVEAALVGRRARAADDAPWLDAFEAASNAWRANDRKGPPPRMEDFRPQVAA